MATPALRLRRVETIWDEVEKLRSRIAANAYAVFQERGARLGHALEDWLAAERQLVWRPPIELAEKDGRFVVEAAVAGVEPKNLEVQITSEELLIRADVRHDHGAAKATIHLCEFRNGPLFRSLRFPKAIDVDKVKAECRNGLLRVIAPIAPPEETRTVDLIVQE